MSEIPRTTLERAARELRSIAQRHTGSFRSRDIDWGLILAQLEQLRHGFETGDADAFSKGLKMVVRRLAAPLDLRNAFGPDPSNQSPKMPPKIFELINHLVETLEVDVHQRSELNQCVSETEVPANADCQRQATS